MCYEHIRGAISAGHKAVLPVLLLFFVTLFFLFSFVCCQKLLNIIPLPLKLIKACLKPFELKTRFGSFFR